MQPSAVQRVKTARRKTCSYCHTGGTYKYSLNNSFKIRTDSVTHHVSFSHGRNSGLADAAEKNTYMNILDFLDFLDFPDFPDFRDVRLFSRMQPHAQIQRVSTPEADLVGAGRLAQSARSIIHWALRVVRFRYSSSP